MSNATKFEIRTLTDKECIPVAADAELSAEHQDWLETGFAVLVAIDIDGAERLVSAA